MQHLTSYWWCWETPGFHQKENETNKEKIKNKVSGLCDEISIPSHIPKPKRNHILVESINGSSLTLERIHDIESGHRLPLRVFGVGHRIFDHILQKGLDHRSGFLVNLTRDPLHSTSPRQTTNCWLGDSGNISFTAFAESFRSSFSQSFASFSSSGHLELCEGVLLLLKLLTNQSNEWKLCSSIWSILNSRRVMLQPPPLQMAYISTLRLSALPSIRASLAKHSTFRPIP